MRLGDYFCRASGGYYCPGFAPANQALVLSFNPDYVFVAALTGSLHGAGWNITIAAPFCALRYCPYFYNLGIIAGAVGLYPIFGPVGLAWGVILGALLHLNPINWQMRLMMPALAAKALAF